MEGITPSPEGPGFVATTPEPPTEDLASGTGALHLKGRRWAPGLAVGAVVAAFGVAAFVLFVGDFMAPAPTDHDRMNQALTVAEQFIDAHNAYDAARIQSLVADGVRVDSYALGWPEDPETFERLMQFQSIAGFRYVTSQCHVRFRPDQALPETMRIICDYALDSRFQRVVRIGRFEGTFYFGVANGLITQVDDHFPLEQWMLHIDTPFVSWLSGVRPHPFTKRVSTHGVTFEGSFETLSEVLDEYEAHKLGR